MKKIIVLITVLAIGIAAALCLVFLPRLQKEQPSVLPDAEDPVKTEEENTDPLYMTFSHQDTFYNEQIRTKTL